MYQCSLENMTEKIQTFATFGATGNGGISCGFCIKWWYYDGILVSYLQWKYLKPSFGKKPAQASADSSYLDK